MTLLHRLYVIQSCWLDQKIRFKPRTSVPQWLCHSLEGKTHRKTIWKCLRKSPVTVWHPNLWMFHNFSKVVHETPSKVSRQIRVSSYTQNRLRHLQEGEIYVRLYFTFSVMCSNLLGQQVTIFILLIFKTSLLLNCKCHVVSLVTYHLKLTSHLVSTNL